MGAEEQVTEIADAKLGRVTRLQVRRELKFLADRLEPGEELLTVASASVGRKDGLAAVTDRRVMFLEKGMVRSHVEEFLFSKINSVETTTKMRKGKVSIYASGNKVELKDVYPKSAVDEIAAIIRSPTRSA